jgi:hypothetical protein
VSEKIPPAPHVAADRRRQNHSHNDGSGDPDEPLLALHPGFHGFALPAPASSAKLAGGGRTGQELSVIGMIMGT